jgi:hypothetical protein
VRIICAAQVRSSSTAHGEKINPAALLQHTVLHDDFVVDFHQHASASVPKSCLAIAVARAGAGDHVRQPQLAPGEAHIDELIFWQLELSHYRLPVRAAKAQPFLLCFHVGLRAAQYKRKDYCGKAIFPNDSRHLGDTLYTYTQRSENEEIISSIGFSYLLLSEGRSSRHKF